MKLKPETKPNPTVKVIEDAQPEVLASSIEKIASAMARLNASGLNRRALLVLLKDASGVSQRDIGLVLDALGSLRRLFTNQKP